MCSTCSAQRAHRLDQTADAVKAAGRRALAVTTDVRDPDACHAVTDTALAESGRVDYLVNNAGMAHTAPSTRQSPTGSATWSRST